jgi:hypothetical protein
VCELGEGGEEEDEGTNMLEKGMKAQGWKCVPEVRMQVGQVQRPERYLVGEERLFSGRSHQVSE